jgi:hypothetical protein
MTRPHADVGGKRSRCVIRENGPEDRRERNLEPEPPTIQVTHRSIKNGTQKVKGPHSDNDNLPVLDR